MEFLLKAATNGREIEYNHVKAEVERLFEAVHSFEMMMENSLYNANRLVLQHDVKVIKVCSKCVNRLISTAHDNPCSKQGHTYIQPQNMLI